MLSAKTFPVIYCGKKRVIEKRKSEKEWYQFFFPHRSRFLITVIIAEIFTR